MVGRQVYVEDAASADGNEASTNDNENDGDDDEDDKDDKDYKDDNNNNNSNEWQRQFKLGRSNVGGNGNNDTNIT